MTTMATRKLYIKCSDLASCIGRHKYKPQSETILDYVKAYDGTAYARMHERLGVATKKDEARQAISEIKRVSPSLALELTSSVKDTVAGACDDTTGYSDIVSRTLATLENKIASDSNINERVKSTLIEECKKQIYTTFGTLAETGVIQAVSKQNNIKIHQESGFKVHCKYLIDAYTPDGRRVDVYIKGKVDGLQLDANGNYIVVEVKNRMKRLFGTVVDYEYVQVMAYMYMMEIDTAKLIENFQGQTMEYDIKRDDEEWSKIVKEVRGFVQDVLQHCHDHNNDESEEE